MRKVSLKGLDLDLYLETLINGLEVYMIPFLIRRIILCLMLLGMDRKLLLL